jgi:hypothetical protein
MATRCVCVCGLHVLYGPITFSHRKKRKRKENGRTFPPSRSFMKLMRSRRRRHGIVQGCKIAADGFNTHLKCAAHNAQSHFHYVRVCVLFRIVSCLLFVIGMRWWWWRRPNSFRSGAGSGPRTLPTQTQIRERKELRRHRLDEGLYVRVSFDR